METVIKICVVLFFLGIGHTNDSKLKIYHRGDDAIVLIDKLKTDGNKDLDIYFSGFANKLHFTHVMLYISKMNHDDYKHVSKYYTGRIKNITMNNGGLSFLLLNVNFMDSGNYTVFEYSWEKGKQSILVTRLVLAGQVDEPMIVPFMCNNTNTSSIKFEIPTASGIYNVAQKNCTYVINQHINRIESCALNETNFYITVRKLNWLDKGNYIVWDDQGFLLDSIFVYMPDYITSSQQSTNVYLCPCSDEENGKGPTEEEITCTDPDMMMGRASNNIVQSGYADEREYEEPYSNRIELTAYLEPIGIETENTEYLNPGSSCSNAYEKLHPYENQGNNMYSSLRPGHITET